MNNKEKSFWDKKYISICSLLILATAIFGPTYWINFHEIPDLKKQISELSIESKYIEITEKEEKLFQRRFENLESKYIDVLASKDTINFWLAVIGILIPFTLGYTIYQKGKTMEMAENEMKEIRKIREKLQKDTEKDKKELKELKDQLSLEMNQLKDQLSLEMNQLIEDKVKQAIQNIDDESDKQRETSGLWSKAFNEVLQKNYKSGIELFRKYIAGSDEVSHGHAYYNIACAYSLWNKQKESIKNLKNSFKFGYFEEKHDRDTIYTDNDFDNIRKTKEFKEFIQIVKDKYGDK